MPKGNCQFKGTGGMYFGTIFIHLFIISFITFGIYAPWAWVRIFRLKAAHTTINGKPVSFTGTGGNLFALMLIQGLITFITFGLYAPWAVCAFFRWKAQNTFVEDKPGSFTGTGSSLFLIFFIHLLILPLLTLGLYYLWGVYRFYAWKEEHTKYGGEKTSFGAGLGGFIKTNILVMILNAVTFGLATAWSMCMMFKWQVSGLAVGDTDVDHFPPVKANLPAMAVLLVLPWLMIGLVVSQFIGFDNMMSATNLATSFMQSPKLVLLAQPSAQAPGKRKYKITASTPAKPPQAGATTKSISKQAGVQPGTRPPVSVKKVTPSPAAPPTAPVEGTRVSTNTPRPPSKSVRKGAFNGETDYRLELNKVEDLLESDANDTNALYNRGWLNVYAKDYNEAEMDYTRVIRLKGKDEDALYNRGVLYVRMERYDRAISDFSEVLKINPRAVDAYCNRGSVYIQLGRIDLALADYTKALQFAPLDGDLYYNRGLGFIKKGEMTKAMSDFRRASDLGQAKARNYLQEPASQPQRRRQ